jgi:hypothetical protein
MASGESPRVATVLIEDGKVVRVGEELALPPGTERRDVTGRHVFPGLIDAYVNFDPAHDVLYLAAGVTTVRDVGGEHLRLQRERLAESRERTPGPSLVTALALLDGEPPATPQAVVLRNAHAVEDYLPILIEERPDFLSIFLGLPEDAWKRTLELGHERELSVWGPVPRAGSLARALEWGQDGLHFLDALLPSGESWDAIELTLLQAPVEALAASGKALVPLFQASYLRLENQGADPTRAELFGLLDPGYEAWWKTELLGRAELLSAERIQAGQRAVAAQARVLERLAASGVPLVPGSGAPQPWLFPGVALHEELGQWLRAGLSPARVLEAATRGAAEALGLCGRAGTITPGAAADLLVTAADPRQDLATLRDPELVVLRGRVLERADLARLLGELGEAQARVREELQRPVEVAPPPVPKDARILLEGTVQSESFGTRVSSECYRVARLAEGSLLFAGHMVYPPSGSGARREVMVQQVVSAEGLQRVEIALAEAGTVLEFQGLWTANTWRMQSLLDGKLIGSTRPLREQPVCAEVSSVTALLILGQAPLSARMPVLQIHPGLEAELVGWQVELDDRGDHQVRTNLGRKAFRLDEHGALELALTQIGPGTLRTEKVRSDSFGGPGLPLPGEKRAGRPRPEEPGAGAGAGAGEPGSDQ